MDTIEIEAKTIDEAIEKACTEFNVSREKLNIEIISEGSAGFLGLGSKKAKIKASRLSLGLDLEAPFELLKKEEVVRPSPVREELQPPAPPAPLVPPPSVREVAAVPVAPAVPEVQGDNASLAQRAKSLLEGILQRMHLDFTVSLEETPDTIILTINGDGGGLLIGKRGQNLDAIQYIVNKAATKIHDERKLIIVDTESYRQRREESLNSLAREFAEKVKKTRKPVTVGHMNAHDRRIIHLALQNDDTIVTKSRGEGEYRKIVILPAKIANREPRP
ncbi:spoIIIJ-associated protein [Syntrophus gentianae]|uniref:RNA-binding protein KhpB n=1 Tax=Syntrophus gentianae TaxID=43775 RepID=A0A1H7WLE5_9BACT|nr:RNA-binding cell elongation regulator Jag/EloR [Syntrophus gentianae]SEM22184.1 spoIIIJ-associated protein [Syntrophus gentianae]